MNQDKLREVRTDMPSVLHELYADKRVVVLGGNGMLGSYVVDLLAEAGSVIAIADIQYRKNSKDVSAYELDCSSEDELERLISPSLFCTQPDVVINCAAKVTGIVYNERHHAEMCLANAELAVAPLKACLNANVSRYVYVSSACVYPAEADIPTEEHWGWNGNPEPTNYGYGLAKRFGEQCCMLAAAEHPWFKPLVLRPSNMYSPRDKFDDENAHVIPRTIRRILSHENPLLMRGTGSVRRSFLHARDAAEGLLLAAATDHVGILNLPAAGRDECSIDGLIAMILGITKEYPRVEFTGQGADGYRQRLSCAKELNRVLKNAGMAWHPETDLQDGLVEVVESCRKWMNDK